MTQRVSGLGPSAQPPVGGEPSVSPPGPGPASSPPSGGGPWPSAGPAAVEVSHLTKEFGGRTAVADVSFSVARGEVFALVSPSLGLALSLGGTLLLIDCGAYLLVSRLFGRERLTTGDKPSRVLAGPVR
jgi:hypothetical protein